MKEDRTEMVGEKVPELGLKDQDGNTIKLGEIKGKKALLSFHPLAWTLVCAKQMLSLEDNYGKFEGLNVVPLGISVDPIPSKKAWAENLEIEKTRILSDFWPHGEYAKKLNIFDEEGGTSLRVNVIVDENGKIELFRVYEMAEVPDVDEIMEFLE